MSRFIVLTVISTSPHSESALRSDQIVSATPHFEVDRPHAAPRPAGTLVKLADGTAIIVSESVVRVLELLEASDG